MAKRGRKAAPPSEQELEFQDAFNKWEASGYSDKKSWDIMFYRVLEACKAIASTFCVGIYNPRFEERVMDAAIYFMNRIKEEHVHPNKLSSWCYLGVKGYIWGLKQQREDRELSFEALNENGFDIPIEIDFSNSNVNIRANEIPWEQRIQAISED